MKKHTGFLIVISFFISQLASGQAVCPVIPLPNHYQQVNATFNLSDHTPVIVEDSAFLASAYFLENQLLRYTGICVTTHPAAFPEIILRRMIHKPGAPEGAYRLEMAADQVIISAADNTGMFYGVISLIQLIHETPVKGSSVAVACWNIDDAPLYPWRGVMLDESRHFFGKKVVKEILDQMALLKLNRFHWHLTDAPGWRLQIKKYPLLALIGGIGNNSDSLAPARYYTQDDIREIVAYARERHITIIPEIDMPGHATAANRAYPQFSGGGTGKYTNFTFNPGNENTYHYLTNILRETSILFPSGMIHLGGDEVAFGSKSWEADSGVRKLMEQEHLNDLQAVEHYFFHRMTDSALKLYRKVLAWDEAADGSLPADSVIIFWWRHDKPEQLKKALEKGYDVVLCPRIPLYFDFVQDSSHWQGRRWGGDFNTLEKVYNFSTDLYPEAAQYRQDILGIQANLWTETVVTKKRLEFLLFTRMTALAEAAWTKAPNRNYKQFLSRLKKHLVLYKKEGIYYYNPLSPRRTPEVIDEY